MITDKDVREYFENNPKSKGVAIFMVDIDDQMITSGWVVIEDSDVVVMNEEQGEVVG
jgi:hypothetical protein